MAPKSIPGEFSLIEEVRRIMKPASMKTDVILGIGDDAAVVKGSGSRKLVLTVDALVEGIHFDPAYFDFESIGWKAMAVNLSDLAAMGAEPRWALVQLTLSSKQNLNQVKKLYKGILKASHRFGCEVVGGNTTLSKKEFSISVTVIGESSGRVLTRGGAKTNDVIAVTGNLGASAAGQQLLMNKKGLKQYTTMKHLRPEPRLADIRRLMQARVKVSACIDISDGLSSELHHLGKASERGMVVDLDALPIHAATRSASKSLRKDVMDLALHGGEEYELLMTLPPREFVKARRLLGNRITAIGVVTAQHGIFTSQHGDLQPLAARGYVHF